VIAPLQVAARDPEAGVDQVIVLAEAVRLHGALESSYGVVKALLS